MNLSKIEKEIIYLKAVTEIIDEMDNREIADVVGEDPHSQIRFNSYTHLKFFNIILVDFLSCTDKKVLGEELPYLRALKKICDNPHFDNDGSVENLKKHTYDFSDWLNSEIKVEKIWFPSIEIETDLLIKRIEFIKICGNISKHNFSRLSGASNDLIGIFKRNSIVISAEESLAIIEEFYEWFHDNIFTYHSSAIAEFLNNIRWGIYEYLRPEFNASIVYDTEEHPRKYHYTYPNMVENIFAKKCYWELMNTVRMPPVFNKFEVSKYMKNKY
jgi:hypothetical protein